MSKSKSTRRRAQFAAQVDEAEAKPARPLTAAVPEYLAGTGEPLPPPPQIPPPYAGRTLEAGRPIWNADYVASGDLVGLIGPQSLGLDIDDVERDVGLDTYERMLKDPEVSRAFWVLVLMVLSGGIQFMPRVTEPGMPDPEKQAEAETAKEYSEFIERVLMNMDTPLRTVLEQMLRALAYGNRVAELVYRIPKTGEDAYKLVLRAMKVKPRQSTAFVVDPFMNVLGLLFATPMQQWPVSVSGGSIVDPKNVLPRDKFAVLTFRTNNDDPRGESVLRSSYNAWNLKTKLWPMLLRYLSHYAVPTLIGTVGPDDADEPRYDENGIEVKNADGSTVYDTATQAMGRALKQLHNATVFVGKNGSTVTPLAIPTTTTAVFSENFAMLDKQITSGIVLQTLATGEAQFGTRAQSQTHMQVLDLFIYALKEMVCEMLDRDVVQPLIRYNFGEEALKLRPKISLGDAERRDFHADVAAVAQLFQTGYLDTSQIIEMDALLGLPKRDVEKAALLADQQQQMIQKTLSAAPGETDAEGGGEPPAKGEEKPKSKAAKFANSILALFHGDPDDADYPHRKKKPAFGTVGSDRERAAEWKAKRTELLKKARAAGEKAQESGDPKDLAQFEALLRLLDSM